MTSLLLVLYLCLLEYFSLVVPTIRAMGPKGNKQVESGWETHVWPPHKILREEACLGNGKAGEEKKVVGVEWTLD